jgi:hypothetical protein
VPDERTPGRARPSTAREAAAKALIEELRIDFERALVKSAAECFERGEVARRDISFAAGQWLPFDQLPHDIQHVVVKSALWLRTNLTEALDEWRGTFRTRFQPLGESLCDINPEMGWIKAQIDAARTTMEGKNQGWLMIATDGTEGAKIFAASGDWLAPGWMEGWPGVVSFAGLLMEAHLNKKQTDEVFQAFGDRVGKSFTLAQESAKNRTQILIAKTEAHSPKVFAPAARRRATLNRPKMAIAVIKRERPKAGIEVTCKELDRRRAPVPGSWKNAGMNSWYEAWKNQEFRLKVKSYISRIPPAAKD